jgi:23S rRNA maturation mini-RNase III
LGGRFLPPLYKIVSQKSTPAQEFNRKKTKKDKKAKFLSLFINFSLTEEEKSYIMKGRNSMGRCKHEAVLFCGR